MSNNSTTFNVNVTDNGTTKKVIDSVSSLNQGLTEASKMAQATGATLARAAQAAMPVAARLKKENQDYGVARGAVGTGAEGRDFAKQAQGLGGLVHVYATFAANLFAVSAAFTALKNAADTSNMVKGLDQLGAVSGKALGSLAKQITSVTDGAISLKDAMVSVAQASAAGMNSTNILRLAESAKKTSQALGIGMPDALSRLSRGITKVEPELLDELGLFVKVDEANRNYARSLNKSVGSLSEFEKRQAFANEVLKQAEDKFSNIKIDANPYDKLLASLSNLANKSLEVVNIALGPLVSMLSMSPTALAVTMAGIAGILLKQAIPAISQWRSQLKDAATEAAARAKRINDSFMEFDIERKLNIGGEAARAANRTANEAIAGIQTSLAKAFPKGSTLLDKAMSGNYNAADYQGKIESQVARTQSYINKLEAARKVINTTDVEHLKAMDADIAANQQKLGQLKQAAMLNKVATEEQRKSRELIAAADAHAEAAPKFGSEAWQRERIAKKAEAGAQKAAILSNVGANTETMGFRAALSELYNDVKKGGQIYDENGKAIGRYQERLTGVAKWSTLVSGTTRILVSTLGTAVNAFGFIGQVIGAAAGTFALLDSFLSENSKEAEQTSQALNTLHAAAYNVDSILAYMQTRDPLYNLSAEAILAKANSLNELSSSMDNLMQKVKAQDTKAGFWDRQVVDAVKNLFGGGLLKDSSKELAYSITQALKVATSAIEKDKAISSLKELFSIDKTDFETLSKALSESPDALLEKGPKAVEIMKQMGMAANESSNKAQTLASAYKTAGKLVDDIITSMLPQDNLGKLGLAMVEVGKSMSEAFKDPVTSLGQLVSLTTDMSKLKLLSPEAAVQLYQLGPQLKAGASQIAALDASISDMQDKLKVAQSEKEDNAKYGENRGNYKEVERRVNNTISQLTNALALYSNMRNEVQAQMEPLLAQAKAASDDAFLKGAKQVQASITIGFEKAGLTISKAFADVLGNTTAGIERRAEIQRAQIDSDIKQLSASRELTLTMTALRLVEEERLIEDKKKELKEKPNETESQKIKEREAALALAKGGLDKASLNQLMRILSDKTTSPAEKEAAKMLLPGAQARAGVDSQINLKLAEKKASYIDEESKLIDKRYADRAEGLDNDLKRYNVAKDSLVLQAQNSVYVTADMLASQQLVEEDIATTTALKDQLVYLKEIEKQRTIIADEDSKPEDRKAAARAILEQESKLRDAQDAADKQKAGRAAKYTSDEIARVKQEGDYRAEVLTKVATLDFNTRNSSLSIQRSSLEVSKQTDKIDEYSYALAKLKLDISEEQLSTEKKIRDEKDASDKYIRDLEAKKKNQPIDSQAAKDIQDSIDAEVKRSTITIANTEAEKNAKIKALEDVFKYEQEGGKLNTALKDSVTTALWEGGKAGAVSLRKAITDELKKPINVVLKALVNPVTSAISSTLTGFTNSVLGSISGNAAAGAASNSFLGTVGASGLGSASGTGIASAIASSGVNFASGFSAIAGGLEGIGSSLSAGFSAIYAGISGGAAAAGASTASALSAGFAQIAGTLGPIALGAYAVYKLIGSPGGGPKTEGGYAPNGMNISGTDIGGSQQGSQRGDIATARQMSATISSAYNQVATQLGLVRKALDVGVFFAKDPQGTSQTQLQVVSSNYNRSAVAGGIENVGRTDQELQDAVTRSISQLIISELKASEISGKVGDYIKAIDISLPTADLEAAVTAATNAQQLFNAAKALGPEFANLANLSVEASKSLIEANGGISTFSSTLSSFFDNYYSESEKLKTRTEYVKNALTDLANNDSLNLTIDQVNNLFDSVGNARVEFRNLVNSQDTATESGKNTYTALLALSSAFTQITESVDPAATMSAADIAKARREMEIEILDLSGQSLKALQATREDELAALDDSLKPLKRRIYFLTTVKALENRIADATLSDEQKLIKSRKEELDATEDILKPAVRYVQALEATKTAKENLFSAYRTERSAMDENIKKLRSSAQTLRDFNKSLLTASNSPLTPQERYQAAREQFLQVLQVAKTVPMAGDLVGIAARDQALSQISSVGSTFLEASKGFYASSDQYAADFQTVTEATSSLASGLDAQADYQTQSLSIFDQQLENLGYISDNTYDSATKITELLNAYNLAANTSTSLAGAGTATMDAGKYSFSNTTTSTAAEQAILGQYASIGRTGFGIGANQIDQAGYDWWVNQINSGALSLLDLPTVFQNAVQSYIEANPNSIYAGLTAHANGGYARGWSLVGEQGPEVVDFQTPGRVYTAQQTRDMFSSANDNFMSSSMQQLVSELQDLRKEVAQLRADQQKQTGDIIMSNYDANAKNAEAVTDALSDSSTDVAYAMRTQVKVA